MKRINLLTGTLIGALIFSGCMKATERPSVEGADIAGKAFAIADIAEITAQERNAYRGDEEDAMLKTADSGVKQLKLEGSKAADLLKNVKDKKTKAALDAHINGGGSIALVVLDDEIKVLKVVKDVELNASYTVLSRAYLGHLKAMSKKPGAKFQAVEQDKALALKNTAPKDSPEKEKFGMVEITSLKVAKFGTLENQTDDYGQRKHFLTVKERPFEMATHIVIGGEQDANGNLLNPPTEAEIAAQKAAEDAQK